jgi:signal peptidase I
MNMHLRARVDRRTWLILLLVVGVYAAVNLGLPRIPINSFITSYVISPALWGMVIWTILKMPGYTVAGKRSARSSLLQLALMIGFCQVLLLLIGGLFSGFGKSPSSFSALGIVTNLVLAGSILAGMELSRAWLINHLGNHTFPALAAVSILYMFLSLPLSQVMGLRPELSSLNFLNSTLLPSLGESLLATLLALLAGPLAATAYRGILQAFWTFCPILPDLPWSLKGLIGAAVPVLGVVVAWNYYNSLTQKARVRQSGGGLQAGWIVTAVFSVAMIWFSVGIFPIHPVLVASGSMSPWMETGDVAIVAKIPGRQVKLGDVIEFRKSKDINVVHRVIEIRNNDAGTSFVTKGDANNAPDADPLLPDNVVGKVVFSVPKIGWVSAGLKGAISQ